MQPRAGLWVWIARRRWPRRLRAMDVVADFEAEKADAVKESTEGIEDPQALPGWGTWANNQTRAEVRPPCMFAAGSKRTWPGRSQSLLPRSAAGNAGC